MKRINELKQEREQLINAMQNIVDVTTTEKRSQTEDETKLWNEKNERVEAIDTEVKVLERQEKLNLSIVTNKHKDTEETITKRYDLGKAINDIRNGGLTGLEKEMHEEAQRELSNVTGVRGNIYIPSMMIRAESAFTKANGVSAGDIPVINTNVDFTVPTALYRELGATVYDNLNAGKLDLPFSKGHTAAKLVEGASASKGRATRTKGTLSASRYQGYDLFSQEYLSESTVFPALITDMVASIDRAVGKDLISAAANANAITSLTGVTNFADLLTIMSNLDNESFTNEGWAFTKELFFDLASKVQTEGDAKKVIELIGKNKGRFAGIDAFGTNFIPKITTNHTAVYGDWSKAYVGFWGGVQLLVDPYSASDAGEIKVTYSRMGDVAVNPYAFASRKNITLA